MWIARDKDGSLWLYETKPCLNSNGDDFVQTSDGDSMQLRDDMFSQVTFENSPKEVEISVKI